MLYKLIDIEYIYFLNVIIDIGYILVDMDFFIYYYLSVQILEIYWFILNIYLWMLFCLLFHLCACVCVYFTNMDLWPYYNQQDNMCSFTVKYC